MLQQLLQQLLHQQLLKLLQQLLQQQHAASAIITTTTARKIKQEIYVTQQKQTYIYNNIFIFIHQSMVDNVKKRK